MAKKQVNAARKKQQAQLLVGVTLLALVAVAVVITINQSSAGSTQTLDENATYAGIPIGGIYAEARQVERDENVAAGVERGIDENGVPYIGSADAPIVIAEIMDFTCPHCATYGETIDQLVTEFVRAGQVRIEMYVLPAEERAPASRYSARGALCADLQGGFWEIHDELLRLTRSSSIENFTGDGMGIIAGEIGLDGEAVRECMNTNRVDAGLLAAQRLANEMNVNSTPTVIYRLKDSDQWIPLHVAADGSIGGGVPFEDIAEVIHEATAGE